MARLVRHQPRSLRRALIVVALLLALPATASATTVKKYKPKPDARCRTHYVKRAETIKEHKHGKVVKVKQTWCVYFALKTKAPTTTTTAAAAAPVLGITLDPAYTQSGLAITYTYSATATTNGSPDSSLPAGVLSLYSDGLLACSINVGGSITGGTCTVTYAAYGAHTLNVIYDAGSDSATTGNETETIEPPAPPPTPAPVATTTTVTATAVDESICSTEFDFALLGTPAGGGTCYTLSASTGSADSSTVPGAATLTMNDTDCSTTCDSTFPFQLSSPATVFVGDGVLFATASDTAGYANGQTIETGGFQPYTVTASYAGSTGYLGSTSASATLEP
jgi:hypothetical protein